MTKGHIVGTIKGYCRIVTNHNILLTQDTTVAKSLKYVSLIIHCDTIWVTCSCMRFLPVHPRQVFNVCVSV